MPENSKVARCVRRLVASGKDKVTAIKICQASTGQSYATGKSPLKDIVRDKDDTDSDD